METLEAMTEEWLAELDRLDIAILSALIDDPQCSKTALASKVFLSRSSVARRLEALEAKGILGTSEATINFEKLGFSVRAQINIAAPSTRSFHVKDELLKFPEVLSLSVCVGENVIAVDLIARDTTHLHEVLNRIQEFGDTSTTVILSRHRSAMKLSERMKRLGQPG